MNQAVRARQQLQEVCSAAIRALAGKPSLELRGLRLFDGGVPAAPAPPHLQPTPEHDDLHSFRGAADGLALRATGTDPALHAACAPAEPMARRIFDLLEQYRVESLVPDEYQGVRANLRHRHAAWIAAFQRERLLDTEQGVLLHALALTCRARVTGQPLSPHEDDRIEPVRITLAPHVGGDMALLRAARHDQPAYAAIAARIAQRVAAILQEIEAAAQQREAQDGSRKRNLALWLGEQSELLQEFPVAGTGQSRLLEDGASGYRVFTRAYDTQLEAASLVRSEQLREFREQLDEAVARAGINVGRLARHLQQLFALPADDGWNSAQEEGRIDGRMLSQLVASPTERRLFKQVRSQPLADSAVTFLLDCSGSMKQYAARLAVVVDVLVRALEQAGIVTEVLGFTTGAWNGGRARGDWSRAGSPAHPGRLNEVTHLVFKPAEESWRRCRQRMAALLKTDFYREGVDGEAVAWACSRLRARGERRRILLVVSDGSPMDGATSLANDAYYLDHHLQEVVARQSAQGDLEIRGLGVGLDLSPYYDSSLVVDLSQGMPLRTFLEMATLLGARQRRRDAIAEQC